MWEQKNDMDVRSWIGVLSFFPLSYVTGSNLSQGRAILFVFVVLLSSSRQMPWQYLKWGHLHSNSLFTNHHIIWSYIIWATGSLVK
jgi:hypothetical protein